MTNPTAQHLAIALKLCRSKPKETSIREHVLNLRKFITSATSNASELIGKDYSVDQAGYWKSMYQKLSEEQENLQNKIVELERTIESTATSTPNNKRNVSSDTTILPSAKKIRTNESTISTTTDDYHFCVTDQLSSGPRATLLRHIFTFQKIQNNDSSDADALTSALLKAFEALSSLLTNFLQNPNQEAQEFFAVAKRSILILSRALHALPTFTQAPLDSLINQLTHKIVSLFRQILTSISSPLPEDATNIPTGLLNELAVLGHLFLKALTTGSCTTTPADPGCDVSKASEAYKAMAASIIEGVLYLLLSRAGELIYTLAFSIPRKPTISEEIFSATKEDASAVRKARREGRCIAPLLTHALSLYNKGKDLPRARPLQPDGYLALQQQEEQVQEKGKNQEQGLEETATGTKKAKPDLAQVELRRLQNTLVQGIFGVTEEVFADTLCLPKQVQLETLSDGEGREQTTDEEENYWFVGRMWEVCGWNVLSLARPNS